MFVQRERLPHCLHRIKLSVNNITIIFISLNLSSFTQSVKLTVGNNQSNLDSFKLLNRKINFW